MQFVSSFSQNLIPVHIAFIPILIPPLVVVMNKLKIDRRAAASALVFGLKAPYIALPVGFGWIFHGIVSTNMTENGMEIAQGDVWKALWIPGLAISPKGIPANTPPTRAPIINASITLSFNKHKPSITNMDITTGLNIELPPFNIVVISTLY